MRVKRFCNAKKGFSLIEVIIALAILMIVVLGLMSTYYSYYRNMVDLRVKTTGQNLAQLQLEDIQNLPISVLSIIMGKNSSDGLGYYPYSKDDPDNDYLIDNYIDKNTDYYIFDSGDGSVSNPLIDGSFRIFSLTGTDELVSLVSEPIPGIGVDGPEEEEYILTLYDDIFPGYQKRIEITDLTPNVSLDSQKIFHIKVTVYWNLNNVQKSVTIEGYKNDIDYVQ